MDMIITAIGEFIWASSCAVVNICLSSGLSPLSVFVSFLCAILALAFYKYTTSYEHMSLDNSTLTPDNDDDDDDNDSAATMSSSLESSVASLSSLTAMLDSNDTNNIRSLSETDICSD